MYHSAEDQSDGISNDRSRQTGDIRLYSYYFRAMGWDATVGVLVCDSALAFVLKLPSLMIKWWSNAEQQHPGAYTDLFAGVFGSLNMVCLMLIVIMTYLLLHIGLPRSSINLHAILLRTVMGSPFWFFVATDSGQVLNRFSQDMSLIAMELPLYLHITLFDAVTCIVETGLILSTSKWAALACPGVLVILYLLQKFYLRTSRQLRLLDLEAKSPLYSHIIETLEGLVTARAFKWQTYMIAQNQKYLDESQRPFYLLYSIQRWLNLVLDLVVAALATIIMALATQLPGTSAGALGLSLVNILSFSENLASLIRSWTELETSLGAVSRVRSFESNTPSEYLPPEKLSSLDQWPSQGEVILQDISVSYRYVLRI
jgi:ABC-type multidrug transport system fused ATPase/permease subunit